ncbi:LuxR C-terminal-related transcriptional regulator [Providencia rettgeri]|uniref:helix-turn-helix transcriptional regulator n=1 Tax=Providencia TaxID=586 RepID=UPI0024AB097E|nr:LuxR C-terminal-related transcriptional regulator [Providencia rettgeri]WHT81959.1 LuxR C-terminal-related transcriptional regulator [Providencia rettgeri]
MTENDRIHINALSQLFPELSPTEGRVAILNTVMGQPVSVIAKEQGVQSDTVKTHFKRAKQKLKCDSQQELRSLIMLRILAHNFISTKKELVTLNLDKI